MKFQENKGFTIFIFVSMIVSFVTLIMIISSSDFLTSALIYIIPMPFEIIEIMMLNGEDNGYTYDIRTNRIRLWFLRGNMCFLFLTTIVGGAIISDLILPEFTLTKDWYVLGMTLYPLKYLIEFLVPLLHMYREEKNKLKES